MQSPFAQEVVGLQTCLQVPATQVVFGKQSRAVVQDVWLPPDENSHMVWLSAGSGWVRSGETM
jgi:hypothetical protein